jgi:hypothetical protein
MTFVIDRGAVAPGPAAFVPRSALADWTIAARFRRDVVELTS